ncbi:down syndrome cell adhesion molecule-like protein Dscam2 [Trichonephila clavipes]|nr:down syndrome cell adhesion molecule-like protein Dscam2 [Trichonephila clavipes]
MTAQRWRVEHPTSLNEQEARLQKIWNSKETGSKTSYRTCLNARSYHRAFTPKGIQQVAVSLQERMLGAQSFATSSPSRIEFSNSSGTELRCSADGVPTPRISWQTRDGIVTKDVPGLRHMRSDGTLVFPAFSKPDYMQDVHDTVYQCLASNNVGTILSREVHVRGDEYAMRIATQTESALICKEDSSPFIVSPIPVFPAPQRTPSPMGRR